MKNAISYAKLTIAVGRLIKKPDELQRVLQIVDVLVDLKADKEMALVVQDVLRHDQGREAMVNRIRINDLDPMALIQKEKGSLGYEYGTFMISRGLSQAVFPMKEIKSNVDWVLSHFYETHDLWHVVTGFDTDIPGELGLQAFYLAQSRSYLPFFVIAALMVNTALYAYDQKENRLQAIADGWNLGMKSKNIVGYDWRKFMDWPISDVRQHFKMNLNLKKTWKENDAQP